MTKGKCLRHCKCSVFCRSREFLGIIFDISRCIWNISSRHCFVCCMLICIKQLPTWRGPVQHFILGHSCRFLEAGETCDLKQLFHGKAGTKIHVSWLPVENPLYLNTDAAVSWGSPQFQPTIDWKRYIKEKNVFAQLIYLNLWLVHVFLIVSW